MGWIALAVYFLFLGVTTWVSASEIQRWSAFLVRVPLGSETLPLYLPVFIFGVIGVIPVLRSVRGVARPPR